jgi:hypothetical protein
VVARKSVYRDCARLISSFILFVAFVPSCDDDKGTGHLGTPRYGVRELAPAFGALAQLMAEKFVFTRQQKNLIYKAIMDTDGSRAGASRTAHLSAVFWRARRLGILTQP